MTETAQIAEAPSAEGDDAKRAAAADRVRKCRERKRTGKALATIEVDEMVLALLASGTSTKPEVLRHDRVRLNRAAERALRHFARMFAKTGEIPGLKPRRITGFADSGIESAAL